MTTITVPSRKLPMANEMVAAMMPSTSRNCGRKRRHLGVAVSVVNSFGWASGRFSTSSREGPFAALYQAAPLYCKGGNLGNLRLGGDR